MYIYIYDLVQFGRMRTSGIILSLSGCRHSMVQTQPQLLGFNGRACQQASISPRVPAYLPSTL